MVVVERREGREWQGERFIRWGAERKSESRSVYKGKDGKNLSTKLT